MTKPKFVKTLMEPPVAYGYKLLDPGKDGCWVRAILVREGLDGCRVRVQTVVDDFPVYLAETSKEADYVALNLLFECVGAELVWAKK
jgi:hypothetical protein